MVNFFLRIFDLLQRRRSLCMWLLVALTAVLFVMVASLKYNENIYDFLPVSGNEQKAITLYQDISGGQRVFAMFRMKEGEALDPDRLTEVWTYHRGNLTGRFREGDRHHRLCLSEHAADAARLRLCAHGADPLVTRQYRQAVGK